MPKAKKRDAKGRPIANPPAQADSSRSELALLLTGNQELPRGSVNPGTAKVSSTPALFQEYQSTEYLDDTESSNAVAVVKKRRRSSDADAKRTQSPHVLKFRNLVPGMTLLGAVRSIEDLGMVISLPCHLSGYVALQDISDELASLVEAIAGQDDEATDDLTVPDLTNLFVVGQCVRCVVLSLDSESEKSSHKVHLSLRASRLNHGIDASCLVKGLTLQASVHSVQDKGYVMTTGLPQGVRAFLRFSDCEDSMRFQVGQVVQCSLKTVSAGGTILNLCCKPSQVNGAVLPIEDSMTISCLQAGSLVDASIVSVLPTGLFLKFMGVHEGSVMWLHAEPKPDNSGALDVLKSYSGGQSVRARVLFTYPAANTNMDVDATVRVGLSLRSHILNWTSHSFGDNVSIGSVVESSLIQRIESSLGLVLSKGDQILFAHISRLSDAHTSSMDPKQYRLMAQLKCRVISHDIVDGVAQVSMQPSIFRAKFLRLEDIQPGMVIPNAIVEKVDPRTGIVIVSISQTADSHLRALCPRHHLANTPSVQQMERRFKIGNQVKVRVLKVDIEKRRITVTMKKTLILSKLPVLSSYSLAKQILRDRADGLWVHGVVRSIMSYGCFVDFVGGLSGLVHRSQLVDSLTERLESVYQVGQIVKCRVVDVDVETNRMTLSFRNASVCDVLAKSFPDSSEVPGMVLSDARVIAIQDDVVCFSTAKDGSNYSGFVRLDHLSDFPSMSQRIFEALKVGSLLPTVMGLRIERISLKGHVSNSKAAAFTAKPSIVEGFSSRNNRIVEKGQTVVGIVQNVVEISGVFVSIGHNIHGLVPVGSLSSISTDDLKAVFAIGRTVACSVVKIDVSDNRYTLALLPGSSLGTDLICQLSMSYFQSLNVLNRLLISGSEHLSEWFGLKPGLQVSGTIEQVLPEVGIFLHVTENINGLYVNQSGRKKQNLGDSLVATILDMDIAKNMVDLIPTSAKTWSSKGVNDLRATVVFAKEDYAVITDTSNSMFAFILTSSINDRQAIFPKDVRIGDQVQVRYLADDPFGRAICTVENIPVQSEIKSKDIRVGDIVEYQVRSIKEFQANVIISRNLSDDSVRPLHGRVHITSLFEGVPEGKGKQLFSQAGLGVGAKLKGRVIGFHDAKTHRWLPISHLTGTRSMVEISMKPSHLSDFFTVDSTDESCRPVVGNTYTGVINEIIRGSSKWAARILISPRFRAVVPFVEISNDPLVCTGFHDSNIIGKFYACQVISVAEQDGKEDLVVVSLRSPITGRLLSSLDDLQEGIRTCGRIVSIFPSNCLLVQLVAAPQSIVGRVSLLESTDTLVESPLKNYQIGQFVDAMVIRLMRHDGQVDISLRKTEPFTKYEDVSAGSRIQGYVVKVSDAGVFVEIGRQIVGRVKISELSDQFIKEWRELVSVGDLVACKVMGVDPIAKKIELSLKLSVVDPEKYARDQEMVNNFEKLSVGAIVSGTVVRVEKYGVLIDLDHFVTRGHAVRGLCHQSELADSEDVGVKNPEVSLYSAGDRIRAKVLSVDLVRKRVALGLKKSYFLPEALESNDIVIDTVAQETEKVDTMDLDSSILESSGLMADFDWDLGKGWLPPAFSGGSLDDNLEKSAEDLDSDNEASEPGKKRSRRSKARTKNEDEMRIALKEARFAEDTPVVPETAEEFNRLLIASPNSSYLWIQFMAFYAGSGQLEQARLTAERALKTIHGREVDERFNIWIALLNLESKLGNGASYDAALKRAIQYNDPKHVYLTLLKAFGQSNQSDKISGILQALQKKFKTSCKAWIQGFQHHFTHKEAPLARDKFKAALDVLPKHKHIKFVLKFAQLEYRHGDQERGRTVCEGLVSNYPKRVDLWSVYLDMEVSKRSIDYARKLFERVTTLKWSPKKMKFLFKKFLDFEKRHGDEKSVGEVVNSARAYVESITGNSIES